MGRAFAGQARVCRTVLQRATGPEIGDARNAVRRKALCHRALRDTSLPGGIARGDLISPPSSMPELQPEGHRGRGPKPDAGAAARGLRRVAREALRYKGFRRMAFC